MVYNKQKNKVFSVLIKKMEIKMDMKNLMVFFLMIASMFLVVGTVSATELVTGATVKVNGLYDDGNSDVNPISVIAGEALSVKINFEALEDASDVRVKIELQGEKQDVEARSAVFDIENGSKYSKTLTLKVPYELRDSVSEDMALNIKVWNGDFETELNEITIRVQRPSYNVDVMSIDVSQTAEVGKTLPIDVVIKNIGYNDLEDMYVTARIPALGIERTSYLGDLTPIECSDTDEEHGLCDDYRDVEVATGTFYLSIPFDAKTGIYTLEVEAKNADLTMNEVTQILIENDFSAGNVITTSLSKNAAVNEDAEYSLIIVNPTDKVVVYRVVAESSADISTSVSESVVAVPAGSSRTVTVVANADESGEYNFDVNVFAGEKLVNTAAFSLNAEGTNLGNPIVIATVILAIIFVVLLVVLLVLIGKKPEKSEEFGESYY